jgi:hypothetical protein
MFGRKRKQNDFSGEIDAPGASAITLTSREHSSVLPASLQPRSESKQVKRVRVRLGSWRSNKRMPTSLNAFFMRSTCGASR